MKLITCFGLLILLAGNGVAQRTIEVDNIKDDKILKARFGTPVYFRFDNVNPLYTDSITITSVAFNFSGDVPAVFSGSNTNVGSDKEKATEKQIQEIADFLEDLKKKDSKSLTRIEDFSKVIDSLQKEIAKLTSQDSLKKEFIKQYIIFKKSLEDLSTATQLENYIIQQLKKEGVFVKDPTTVKSSLLSHFKSINEGNDNIDEFRKSIFRKLDHVNNSYLHLSYIYEALSKTLEPETLKLTGKIEDGTAKVTLTIKDASVAVERKKFFADEFLFAKQRIALINKDSTRNALINVINSGADLYAKIQRHDFSKTEGPFFITDDQKTFKPQLKNEKGQVVKEFEVPVRAHGGVKVDFSAGYLLTFRGDEEFRNVYDTTGKAVGIKETEKENLTHAIGALINVYRRSSNGLSLGGSFGISIPVDGKVNFYLGASLLALEKNRLVLTAGVSWTKVKLLNRSNLEVKNNEYVFSGNIREPQYDNRYRPGFFLGLTYNIFTLSPQGTK